VSAVVRAHREVHVLVDVVASQPAHRDIPRAAAALAALLLAERVVGVLDDHADLVVLAGPDGLRHVAIEERIHRLRPAAELPVDDDAGDHVDRRQAEEERATGHLCGDVHAGAVDDAMGEAEVRPLPELIARHGDRGPEGLLRGGQGRRRAGAVDDFPHLVVTANLPEARERHLDARWRAGAFGGYAEHLHRRLPVRIALPVFAGLVPAVRVELALADAERVGGIEDPVRHLLAVLLLHGRRRADLDLVLARAQVRLAELHPGHLGPLGQIHQVRGVVGGLDRLPVAAVDAPVEGGAHGLVADAVPHLVTPGRGRVELVAQHEASLRHLRRHLVGRNADLQPLLAGQVLPIGPADALHLHVAVRRAFALDPYEVRGPGVRGRHQSQREGDQSLHLSVLVNGNGWRGAARLRARVRHPRRPCAHMLPHAG
jgi:hypothetical protein